MKILAVDSSAKSGSVAILEDGKKLAEFYINTTLTHSQTLMPMIEWILKSVNFTTSDIDCFAVSVGPGSFTGLRIGISCIKGLAFSENKPCVAVSTLQALSRNISQPCIICSVMDARCSQVYTAQFEFDGESYKRLTPDEAISIKQLEERIQNNREKTVLVGDGSLMCYNIFKETCEHLFLADENVRFQHAFGVAQVAFEEIEKGNVVSSEELVPTYLRLPQAQRELLLKKGNVL